MARHTTVGNYATNNLFIEHYGKQQRGDNAHLLSPRWYAKACFSTLVGYCYWNTLADSITQSSVGIDWDPLGVLEYFLGPIDIGAARLGFTPLID